MNIFKLIEFLKFEKKNLKGFYFFYMKIGLDIVGI